MRRSATVLALFLVAGVSLVGCRTSPNVAAYVGDETITVGELQDAVADLRADPEVSAGEDPGFSRSVLDRLLRSAVFDSAAEHFGVSPDPGGPTELFEQLFPGEDIEALFQQQAAAGASRADTLERLRQIAVLRDIGIAEGGVEEPTEASLRATYESRLAEQPEQIDLGYVNVPDQAQADALVAALEADPGSYATVAEPYLDAQATLPAPRTVAVGELAGELPPALAAQVAAAPPGTVFSTSVEGLSGVLVVVVAEAAVPTFEEVRQQLEAAALNQAIEAGGQLLAEYQRDLDIDVNPAYGSLEEGSVVEAGGGVVRLLETED